MFVLLLACSGPDEEPPRTNNAPQVAELRIDPDPADARDDLVATVETVDLDGDEVTLTYTWTVDGHEQDIETGTLPAGTAIKHQLVELEVRISDGFSFGTPATASIELDNAPPELHLVTIEPDPPGIGDPLTCVGDVSEADGDELSWIYGWFVEDERLDFDEATLEMDLERNTKVQCEVSVSDGEVLVGPTQSEPVYIGNSPPTTPLSPLVPDPPVACSEGRVEVKIEATDPDGDAITYGVSWLDGGTEIHDEFVYPAETFEEGGLYSVEVWADDGFFQGEPATLEFQAVAGGETVGNGIDDDCDGEVDEWIDFAFQGQQLWWDETESAQAGFTLAAGDMDGDGRDELIATRSGENDLLVFLGSSMDPAHPVLSGWDLQLGGAEGTNALAIGEVDGDGSADLLVGSPGANAGGFTDAGQVHLVLGQDLVDGADLDELAVFTLSGEEDSQGLSGAVALGDVDGDGLDDLVVGDPRADAPGREAGRVLVFTDISDASPALEDADILLEGGVRSGLFGTSVAVLDDVDGDGISEVSGGALDTDSGGTDSGTVAVWFGGGGLISGYVSAADVRVHGSDDDAHVGREPAGAGDIDGDGLAELAVGSEESPSGLHMPGTISIFQGAEIAGGGEYFTEDAWVRVQSEHSDAWLGLYGAGPLLGDADGGGTADLVAGAAGEEAIYLWRAQTLAAGGDFDTSAATLRVEAEEPGDYFGRWALLADTDGDGVQDMISSAWRSSQTATRAGSLYVFRPPFGVQAQSWEPICEDDGVLLLCRTPMTWDEARAHCNSLAADLATLESVSWNLAASETAAGFYPAGIDRGEWWFGLNDRSTEGSWVWLDETEPSSFTAWGSEPAMDDSKNCAVLNEPAEGLWDDRPCSEERFFICR